ncbi:MAG: hypothetical protein GWN07_41280, partial [Actinobacteria bacterium]|nr:hypothetical protein [Actinomycetota bacterium]NIS37447.1 hypothetical protein [Actinomycetota bacterium]NIU66588.1 hypothetical protein [Actinomycetota bacterium]NIW28392.1 hypothetical protein [Actinomycetota bacterium]NIX25909.1 hypothetical protein [Actinomycetota bacterium]
GQLGIDEAALARLVIVEVEEAIGTGYCCSPLSGAVANVVVSDGGIIVFLDSDAGIPGHVGLLAVPLSWSAIADLVSP